MEENVDYVRVINRTDFKKPIVGRFDGKDYTFPKDKPVDIPVMVAQHIFDFGKDDKSQALARLGWAHTSADIEAGMETLGKICFEEPPEMIEAPPKNGRGRPKKLAPVGKTGTAGPPVNAGGTEGEASASPNGPEEEEDGGDDENF